MADMENKNECGWKKRAINHEEDILRMHEQKGITITSSIMMDMMISVPKTTSSILSTR
jgi:hypothetical protein